MSRIKKVRCPNPECREINTINIDEELEKNLDEVALFMTLNFIEGLLEVIREVTAWFTTVEPNKPPTEYITVTCCNPQCRQQIKVRVG